MLPDLQSSGYWCRSTENYLDGTLWKTSCQKVLHLRTGHCKENEGSCYFLLRGCKLAICIFLWYMWYFPMLRMSYHCCVCFEQLYAESLVRFRGGSPYIYPLHGLGELPQVRLFRPLSVADFDFSVGWDVTCMTCRDLPVLVPFMVAPTCLTNRNARLSFTLKIMKQTWGSKIIFSNISKIMHKDTYGHIF